MGYVDFEKTPEGVSCSFYKNNGEFVGNVLTTQKYLTEEDVHRLHVGIVTGRFEAEVSQDFCGRLTALERKELEVIWNKLTDYGKQPMTYQKYLDAGLEIMTMAYLTGKRDSKNSG